jgi:hypothetical protein
MRVARAGALGLILWLAACQQSDRRFADPAATYRTYRESLAAGDFGRAWSCYTSRYREAALGDSAAWVEGRRQRPAAVEAELRREVAAERVINARIAYLMFDQSTLDSPQASPFCYFVHEPTGWMMTTHLDTLFHQELEKAIAKGEFSLPNP